VIQQPLNLQLSISPQWKHSMLKSFHNFFYSYKIGLSSFFLDIKILCSDNNSVCTLTNRINNFVAPINFEFGVDDHVCMHVFIGCLVVRQFGYLRLFVFLSICSSLHIWLLTLLPEKYLQELIYNIPYYIALNKIPN